MSAEIQDRDEKRLAELGYKQELNRSWSGFQNFAISFTIISVLAGCFTTYYQGWNNGGPIAISWGWPIVSVFIGVTIIRMVMLGLFAVVSRQTVRIPTIHLHWWMVLSAAGVKGAFSLLMLHMFPTDYDLRDLFEAVVVGNVLLSTFLYPVVLFLIIGAYRKIFEAEYQADHLLFE